MNNRYELTRLKLALLYFAIIFFIVIFFSIDLVNEQFSQYDRVEHFTHNYYSSIFPQINFNSFDNTINDIKSNILINIVKIDALIILIAGFSSYYLSGKTLEPIQDALKDQQKFVADASHELKTPLTSLLIQAEVLERSKNATLDEFKQFTSSAIEEVKRLTDLTNNLLDIAKGEKPNMNELKENIDLNIWLMGLAERFRPQSSQKKVSLSTETLDTPSQININPDKLTQLFDILIDNAIKYNKEDGQIHISITKEIDNIVVIIEDTGIGISKEDIPHLFDRFFRVSQDRSTKGFGLGLSIAKDIMNSINGKISIQSEPNLYTKVILTFHRSSNNVSPQ